MAFNTHIKLYTQADDQRAAKVFPLFGFTTFFARRLKFREEVCPASYYRDKYADLSRGELFDILKEYRQKYHELKHITKQVDEIIAQIEMDSTEYELYQIHLAEWESGLD